MPIDKLSSKEKPIEAEREKTISYYVRCPQCSDYHEGDINIGEIIECICGAWVKVVQ